LFHASPPSDNIIQRLGSWLHLTSYKESYVKLLVAITEKRANPLLERIRHTIRAQAYTDEQAAVFQIRRKLLDDPPRNVFSVLSAVIENIFRLQDGHIGRMRHDPIKGPPGCWQIEITLAGGDVFELVQAPVKFREVYTPGGDVKRISMLGAVSRREECCDTGSATDFQKSLARRSRDHG
jgi:hypothetical protein